MRHILENEVIRCEIDSHGAELKSLVRKCDGREMMWCGNPEYWNRTSPVLFPFVGGVRDKKYRHEGREYSISQHGFARDMEFVCESESAGEIWFSLSDSAETLEKYPFHFCLRIGYRITGATVKVMWQVKNTNDGAMWFSIGAHPGFAIDCLKGHAFVLRDKNGALVESICNRVFGGNGCVSDRTETISTKGGTLALSEELFDNDALVLENGQIGSVEVISENSAPLLKVDFDTPLVGLWSPPHKNAPFVCIEPWYGRCDSESFSGELKDREYEQRLDANGVFNAEYEITVSC